MQARVFPFRKKLAADSRSLRKRSDPRDIRHVSPGLSDLSSEA